MEREKVKRCFQDGDTAKSTSKFDLSYLSFACNFSKLLPSLANAVDVLDDFDFWKICLIFDNF